MPRANYDFYKSFLDSAFDSFVSTEKAYISYCTALDKEEALTDKVKLAYQNMARVTGTLNADNHDLKVMLQKKNDEIVQQGFDVIDAQKVLSAAYDEEKSAIKAAFGVSVPQMYVSASLPKSFTHC